MLQQQYLLNTIDMKRKTRSLLEEINAMSPKRDKKHIVESNGQQVIVTAINLINLKRLSQLEFFKIINYLLN